MTLPTTALLFQTHFFDRGAARLFEKLRRQCPPGFECFVLMHVPPGTPKPPRLASVPHHFVTTPEVRALPYPRKNATWDSTGKRWDFWLGGHCDLVAMHFFNAHPDFERYWVIEYDVRFTGNWRTFFDAFEDSPSDFLSTSVRRRRDNPVWVNWASVQGPAPEEDIERHRVGAFTPLYHPVKPFKIPVKPFKIWPETKQALWELRVWQGARRRELVAWLRGLGGAARGLLTAARRPPRPVRFWAHR